MKKGSSIIKNLVKIIIFLFPFFLYAEDELKLPELKTRVMDEASVLTESDKTAIINELEELEKSKGSQIALLTVDTIGKLTIEEYGIKLAEKWKLGRKDVSDGAILIVALKDRKMRIEVGRGLEGFLTDLRTKQIQERIIKPEFKSGNYSGGIRRGVEAMIAAANGAELELAEEDKKTASKEDFYSHQQNLVILFGAGFFILRIVYYSKPVMILTAVFFSAAMLALGMMLEGLVFGLTGAGIGLLIYIIIIYFGNSSSSVSSGIYSSGSSGGGGSGSFSGGGGSSSSWD